MEKEMLNVCRNHANNFLSSAGLNLLVDDGGYSAEGRGCEAESCSVHSKIIDVNYSCFMSFRFFRFYAFNKERLSDRNYSLFSDDESNSKTGRFLWGHLCATAAYSNNNLNFAEFKISKVVKKIKKLSAEQGINVVNVTNIDKLITDDSERDARPYRIVTYHPCQVNDALIFKQYLEIIKDTAF